MPKFGIHHCWYIMGTLFALYTSVTQCDITSRSKNDPAPVFTALDPHNFMLTKSFMEYCEPDTAPLMHDHVTVSVSPFSQSAFRGRNITGDKTLGGTNTATINYDIHLSDLEGRPNMLTLLYGNVPQGQSYGPVLTNARNQLFPGVTGTINDSTLVDPLQLFASFSFPGKYVKRGARFEFMGKLGKGFVLKLQTGYVSLTQSPFDKINQNCNAVSNCGFTLNTTLQANVNTYLMDDVADILPEIGYHFNRYNKHGWEEVRLSALWRGMYEMNKEYLDWPQILAVPFFMVTGSVAPGPGIEHTPYTPLYAAAIGNDKHHAVGFMTGIDLNFIETVEIGIEAGVTHFFKRDVQNLHIPTNKFQTGIFPFATDASVSPGMNWHFTARLAAYHFLERLSGHFEYTLIEHKRDEICLKKNDPAFLPHLLGDRAAWKVQVANFGFTYDISPTVGLGFVWQAPVAQKNAYRSSTVLFSIYATF